jgi:hypothetical protein
MGQWTYGSKRRSGSISYHSDEFSLSPNRIVSFLAPTLFSSVPSTGKSKAGERERGRGNKKRATGEWRRLGVGKGMNTNVSWRFAEVPFWKMATGGPLGRFCPCWSAGRADLGERHCGLRIRWRFSPPADYYIFRVFVFALCILVVYSREVLGHILGACRCFG